MRVNRSTLSAIGARGAGIFSSFALTVLVARLVGVESAGVFFLLSAVVTVLSSVGRFGSETMVLKLVGGEGMTRASRQTIKRLALVAAIGSSIVMTLSIAVVIAAPSLIDAADLFAVVVAFSATVAQSLHVYAGAVLRGIGKLGWGVFAELGSAPLLAFLTLGALGFAREITVDDALIVFALTSWITAAWSMGLVWRKSREVSAESEHLEKVEHFRFDRVTRRSSVSMMGVSVLYFGSVWSPVFLLSALDSLEGVALYTAAVRLANIITLIPSIQASYLAPRFAALIRAPDPSAVSKVAGNSAFQALAICLVPALALVFGAQPIVTAVYGIEYETGAPLLSALALGALVSVSIGQVTQLALLSGLEHSALLCTSLALIGWLTVGVVAILVWSTLGAALVASLILSGLSLALSIILVRKRGIRSWATPCRS